MFVKAVPDNKSGRKGCYCSLVETYMKDGAPAHRTVQNRGVFEYARVPVLKAAYNKGVPDEILAKEKAKIAETERKYGKGK